MSEANETFVPAEQAALRLGVPTGWLRSEAERGDIPHLKIGRRIVFNVAAVEKALLEKATAALSRTEVAHVS